MSQIHDGEGRDPVAGRDRADEAGERDGTGQVDPVAGHVVAGLRRGPGGEGPSVDQGVDALVAAAIARADTAELVDVAWVVTDTPIGPLTLTATDRGVLQIAFGDDDRVLEELAAGVSPRVLYLPARLDALRRQLDEYFAGRRHRFEVPLDRRLSRGFRAQVLAALAAHVGYGETTSYKDLAELAGNPRASRAVGSAMATNPHPIVVPCHRVLRSGGALGSYGGGTDTKAWLLRLEGARLML